MSSWAKEKSCRSGLFAVLDYYHNEMQVNIGSSICILTHSSRTEDVVAPKWPLSPHSLFNDHDCRCHSPKETLRAIYSHATTSFEELFREAVVRPLSGQNITNFLKGFAGYTGKYVLSYAGSGPAVSIFPPESPIGNKEPKTELVCTNFWWSKAGPFPQYFATRIPKQDTPGFGIDGLIALIKYIKVYHQQARCTNSVICVLDLIHEELPKGSGPAICVLNNNPALEYAQVEPEQHLRILEWIKRTSESESQRGPEYNEFQKALEERRQLTSMGHVRHAPIHRPDRSISGSGLGSNPISELRYRSGTNPNAAWFRRAAAYNNPATRIYSGLGSLTPLSILANPQRQDLKALKSPPSPPSSE